MCTRSSFRSLRWIQLAAVLAVALATTSAHADRIGDLCDVVGAEGGSETAMERYLPALQRTGLNVRVVARRVTDPDRFGVPARRLAWADEYAEPCAHAADAISAEIQSEHIDVVLCSNVFDAAVLKARLAPIVKLGLCEGNVCPHVHSYLMPDVGP